MKKIIFTIFIIFWVLPLYAQTVSVPKTDKKPVLVVMDLKPLAGISSQESTSITGFIRSAVKKTQKYQLINREDMESIAKNYKIELAICDTDTCLLKLGLLSGAQKLVAGDIGVLSGKVIINVRMVDVASDSLVNEFVCSKTCAKDADVIQQTMNIIVAELCGVNGAVISGGYSGLNNVALTKEIVTSQDGAEMVLISEGEFLMGSSDRLSEYNEQPQHKVYLGTYYIDKYEVTNKQFKKFVDETGYVTDAEKTGGGFVVKAGNLFMKKETWVQSSSATWKDPLGNGKGISDKMDHPVIQVSWNDAVAYAQWAGKRLPTEAEWEKACRAGSKQKYFFDYKDFDKEFEIMYSLSQYGWYLENSKYTTHPVGTKKANNWFIYDMYGNVSEWCADS